jgi:cytochrome c556
MRNPVIAATAALLLLGACRGPATNQAKDAEADMNAATNAGASSVPAALTPQTDMSPVSGGQARAVMHERHEGMEAIGKANKAIKRELSGGSPDLGAVREAAAKLAGLSQKASGWFPAGTGPELDKSGAKPEIWQTPQDFAARMADFQKAAAQFNAAAGTSDLTRINAAFADLGKACKACHDKYRAEMHH